MPMRANSNIAKAVTFVADSGNSKINGSGRVSATYASIAATCPAACPLRDSGCYAQSSHVGMIVRRLDAGAQGMSADDVATIEALAIDGAFSAGPVPQDGARGLGRPLRLHVSGDARTPRAAATLAAAARRWVARSGGPVWSYTHAWRRVARRNWRGVSVLASVESTSDGSAALARGYAPAAVVASHPQDGKAFARHGVTWIPCPSQTRGIGCTDCRLCFDADALVARRSGISFAAHGASTKRVLSVIQG